MWEYQVEMLIQLSKYALLFLRRKSAKVQSHFKSKREKVCKSCWEDPGMWESYLRNAVRTADDGPAERGTVIQFNSFLPVPQGN